MWGVRFDFRRLGSSVGAAPLTGSRRHTSCRLRRDQRRLRVAGVSKGAGLVICASRLLARGEGAWLSGAPIHDGLRGQTGAAATTAVLETLSDDGWAEARSIPIGRHCKEDWRWRGANRRNAPDSSRSRDVDGQTPERLRNSASTTHSEERQW